MNGRRMAGAIIGALVAGLGITAMLMAGEKKSGKPSELTLLERTSAHKLGVHTPPDDSLPDASEQAIVQGGHLLLSALAGAAYVAVTDEDSAVVPSGILFGVTFYGIAHWLTGPLLGVKQPEWCSDTKTIGMHAANHIAFGLAVAAGAKAATRT